MKKLFQWKLFRFLITGGCSTGIDFVIYIFLSRSVNLSVAKTISMCTASIFSYFINKKWTFQDKKAVYTAQVFKYILAQAVNLGVNVGMNAAMYSLFHQKVIAFVLATGTAMTVNYLLQKRFVFPGKDT